jgi:hypothetical protein
VVDKKRGRLSHGAKIAALEIANYDCAYFSVGYLATLLEVGESTARGYCAELEAAGVIARNAQTNGVGGCATNHYEIMLTEFDLPSVRSKSRGTPTEIPPHKQEVVSERSQKEEEQKEIKAAVEPPVDNREVEVVLELDELRAGLDVAFKNLEPETEPPLERPRKTRDPEKARTRGTHWPRRVPGASPKPLDLCDRRTPLPLSSELIVALRDVPGGQQALELLWKKLMHRHPPKRIQQAVRRTIEYHRDRGVDDAVKFVQLVLRSLKRDEEEAIRYEEHIKCAAPDIEVDRSRERRPTMPGLKKRPVTAVSEPRCTGKPDDYLGLIRSLDQKYGVQTM